LSIASGVAVLGRVAVLLIIVQKADVVLFLKALQGDPVDPVVADPEMMPH
jgi:hypothetical protein